MKAHAGGDKRGKINPREIPCRYTSKKDASLQKRVRLCLPPRFSTQDCHGNLAAAKPATGREIAGISEGGKRPRLQQQHQAGRTWKVPACAQVPVECNCHVSTAATRGTRGCNLHSSQLVPVPRKFETGWQYQRLQFHTVVRGQLAASRAAGAKDRSCVRWAVARSVGRPLCAWRAA